MCYHVSFKAKAQDLIKAFDAPFPEATNMQEYYHANGFAHPNLPVLSIDHGRSINLYNWGLIPFWVKDWESAKKLRNQTLNAKSEEVFEKPSFRDAIKSRRCVIPVSGFYEWKHKFITETTAKGLEVNIVKDKIPFFIHPKEEPFFYLQGIYSHWTDPGTRDTMSTFSILTGAANTLMADIHNSAKRMPLMIDRKNIDAWISDDLPKEGIIELMQPCDDRNMSAYTVSKDLSNPKVNSDVPEIMQEVDYGTI